MKAVTIIKTDRGFAMVRATETDDIPACTLDKLLCFGDLEDSLSYRHDGVISALRDFFKDAPEAEQ